MTKSRFAIGIKLSEEMATATCKALAYACELHQGDFSWEHNDFGCTVFTAPRKLGTDKHMRSQAVIDGLKIGLLH